MISLKYPAWSPRRPVAGCASRYPSGVSPSARIANLSKWAARKSTNARTWGPPWLARQAGEAHSSRRLDARCQAIMRASGGSPKRMQTSKASLVSGGGSTSVTRSPKIRLAGTRLPRIASASKWCLGCSDRDKSWRSTRTAGLTCQRPLHTPGRCRTTTCSGMWSLAIRLIRRCKLSWQTNTRGPWRRENVGRTDRTSFVEFSGVGLVIVSLPHHPGDFFRFLPQTRSPSPASSWSFCSMLLSAGPCRCTTWPPVCPGRRWGEPW